MRVQNQLPLRGGRDQFIEIRVDDLESKLFGTTLAVLEQRLSYSRRLTRAFDVIKSQFEDGDLTLDQASRTCGIEGSYLNRLLREYSGFTFHELLVRYRLLKVATLLSRNNSTMLEAAISSGFGTLRTFDRNFKRFFGISPSRFRDLTRMRFRTPQ